MLQRYEVIPLNERRYNLIRTNHRVITLWEVHLKFKFSVSIIPKTRIV